MRGREQSLSPRREPQPLDDFGGSEPEILGDTLPHRWVERLVAREIHDAEPGAATDDFAVGLHPVEPGADFLSGEAGVEHDALHRDLVNSEKMPKRCQSYSEITG